MEVVENIWIEYEKEKRKIYEESKSQKEYEERMDEMIERLGV